LADSFTEISTLTFQRQMQWWHLYDITVSNFGACIDYKVKWKIAKIYQYQNCLKKSKVASWRSGYDFTHTSLFCWSCLPLFSKNCMYLRGTKIRQCRCFKMWTSSLSDKFMLKGKIRMRTSLSSFNSIIGIFWYDDIIVIIILRWLLNRQLKEI